MRTDENKRIGKPFEFIGSRIPDEVTVDGRKVQIRGFVERAERGEASLDEIRDFVDVVRRKIAELEGGPGGGEEGAGLENARELAQGLKKALELLVNADGIEDIEDDVVGDARRWLRFSKKIK